MVEESVTPTGAPPSRRIGTKPARPLRFAAIGLVAVLLLGSLVYLLILAFEGATLVSVTGHGAHLTSVVHHPRPWLLVAAIAGTLGLLGWAQAERDGGDLAGAEADRDAARASAQQSREELAESDRRRGEAESEREQLRSEVEAERHRRRDDDDAHREAQEKIIRAWRAEREWNRELRGHIERLQRAHGALGRHEDVGTMVLELTMSLVDADKGILLSSASSGDGLDVVAFSGWDNDPGDSALAQRFATEVVDRNTTVREDQPPSADKRGPADDEVTNLLAIPIYLTDAFSGVIVCANRDGGFAEFDDEVLLAVGDQAGAVLQNSRLHGDLRSAYLSTISVLADAIELKDPELRGHSDSVSQYVLAVADRLEFAPARRESLVFASLLHDVGKLGISERILLKPARLTAEERTVIQMHPRIGYELVRRVPALREIAPAVLHHHERFDGDGYPARLRGDMIPLEARIIAIADTFSAITSDRPYDPPRSPEEACVELERCAGGQFDPQVVQMFCEEVRRRPPETRQGELEVKVEAQPEDPELAVHRADGDYTLGGRSFAVTDSLTLLYSHRHFHESVRAEAQRAAVQGRPFGVLVLKLHDLGEINRVDGFGAGDDALRRVSDLVQAVGGQHDAVAFRASGRRLSLLVPDTSLSAVTRLASELSATVRATAPSVRRVAIGAAAWSEGEDGEQVIERARLAAEGLALVDVDP